MAKKVMQMINTDTNYWSEQIIVYCGERRLSLRQFASKVGLHENTIINTVNCKSKEVSPKTAGILFNAIFREKY